MKDNQNCKTNVSQGETIIAYVTKDYRQIYYIYIKYICYTHIYYILHIYYIYIAYTYIYYIMNSYQSLRQTTPPQKISEAKKKNIY